MRAYKPRRYSVRVIHWDTGEVDTVGPFQAYRTSASAHNAARKLSLAPNGIAA